MHLSWYAFIQTFIHKYIYLINMFRPYEILHAFVVSVESGKNRYVIIDELYCEVDKSVYRRPDNRNLVMQGRKSLSRW